MKSRPISSGTPVSQIRQPKTTKASPELLNQSKRVSKLGLRQISSLHTFHTIKKAALPSAKVEQRTATRFMSKAQKAAGRVMSSKPTRGR